MTDALTGLPTFEALALAVKEPTAAIFFDIDALRRVTCDAGPLASDEVLKKVAAWLGARGPAVRVAGDEFVLLLPGRTIETATAIANELVSQTVAGVTVSAVVFIATPELVGQRRESFVEPFAEALYRQELASARDHANVSVWR